MASLETRLKQTANDYTEQHGAWPVDQVAMDIVVEVCPDTWFNMTTLLGTLTIRWQLMDPTPYETIERLAHGQTATTLDLFPQKQIAARFMEDGRVWIQFQ